jgi:hypothetical protein
MTNGIIPGEGAVLALTFCESNAILEAAIVPARRKGKRRRE